MAVSIQSAHGTYLRAHPGGEAARLDLQTHVAGWELFNIVSLGQGKVAIKSHHGTYIRAHLGWEGAAVDLQTHIGAWEQWEVIQVGDGKVAFKSSHNTYLRAHPGGTSSRIDLQTKIGLWEKFTIEAIPQHNQVAPKFSIPCNTSVNGFFYGVSTVLDQRYEIQEDETGSSVVNGELSSGTQYNNFNVSFAAKKDVIYKILLRHKNSSNGQWEANYISANSQLKGVAGGVHYMAIATDDGGKAYDYNDAMLVINWAQYK